jgi:hypothetical protein
LRAFVKIEGKEIEPIVQKLAKLAVNLPDVCVCLGRKHAERRLGTWKQC